jgi:hypothetical protein
MHVPFSFLPVSLRPKYFLLGGHETVGIGNTTSLDSELEYRDTLF